MARYRCNHCKTVFEGGGVRDCCLPAAVAEQNRLRKKVLDLRTQILRHASSGGTMRGIDDLFKGMF